MKGTNDCIEAMFCRQMEAAYRFARLLRTGMGNGIDRDGI